MLGLLAPSRLEGRSASRSVQRISRGATSRRDRRGESAAESGGGVVSEHLTPHPFSEEGPEPPSGMPKTADYLHRFRGTFDREPRGVCWVRVFEEDGQTPVIVMGELPQNTSTSVTNLAEVLAPELIRRHFPERFEELPPAIFIEHYVEERTPEGRLGRKATWDRLSFQSWTPRRVWLSGQERLSFGEPQWTHLPESEVEALLGREEMQALPPPVPLANDQP